MKGTQAEEILNLVIVLCLLTKFVVKNDFFERKFGREKMSSVINELYCGSSPLAIVFQSLFKSSMVYLEDYDIDLIKFLLNGLDVSSVSGTTLAERMFLRLYKNYEKRGLKVCIFLLVFAYMKNVPYFRDGKEYLLDDFVNEHTYDNTY